MSWYKTTVTLDEKANTIKMVRENHTGKEVVISGDIDDVFNTLLRWAHP